jgi:cysteine desulfurase
MASTGTTDGIIYLDHAATTPLDPRVLEVMRPYFAADFANPSSVHQLGARARRAVDEARAEVAEHLGAERDEIVFTSGGSEAINLAIKGVTVALAARRGPGHVVTLAIEHAATLRACAQLEELGHQVTRLPVDFTGRVDPGAVAGAVRPTTFLVSLSHANNEIGTLQPVTEVAAVCRQAGVLLHVDAVQAVEHLPVDVQVLGADLLSISGHKFHGPKGTGVLVMRRGTAAVPLIDGGGQERGHRSGTENVPGIIGLAAALRLAVEEREQRARELGGLRDRLWEGIQASITGVSLNGHPTLRLPGNLHLTFDGIEGDKTREGLLSLLDQAGVCASSGSACHSRTLEPSHVLTALGRTRAQSFGSLRFTLGRSNTAEHIERVLAMLPGIVQRLRSLSALAASPHG